MSFFMQVWTDALDPPSPIPRSVDAAASVAVLSPVRSRLDLYWSCAASGQRDRISVGCVPAAVGLRYALSSSRRFPADEWLLAAASQSVILFALIPGLTSEGGSSGSRPDPVFIYPPPGRNVRIRCCLNMKSAVAEKAEMAKGSVPPASRAT